MKMRERSIKSSSDSLVLSVRLTRLTASVTISAPEASWHLCINALLRYFPVPMNNREWNVRSAILSTSSMLPLWSGASGNGRQLFQHPVHFISRVVVNQAEPQQSAVLFDTQPFGQTQGIEIA